MQKPRKIVYLTLSLHHDHTIDEETGAQRKPEIISFYNTTKSDVDVVDKLSRTYDVSLNLNRWPLTIFFVLVNHAGIKSINESHSSDVKQQYPIKKSNYRRLFLKKKIGVSLLEEYPKNRKESERLPKELRKRLGEPSFAPPTKKPNIVQRCLKCPTKKDRRQNMFARNVPYRCASEHCIFICENCSI